MRYRTTIIISLSVLLLPMILLYGWQSPITLTPEWNDASVPWLAFDAQNNAKLVWRIFDGQYTRIQTASCDAQAGSWSSSLTISPTPHAREPKIVVNDAGNAAAIWRIIQGSNFVIMASYFDVLIGQWQEPFYLPLISDQSNDSEMPDIALNNENHTVACWQQYDGTTWRVQAATRTGSGSWTLTAALSNAGLYAFSPQVVMTDATSPSIAIVFYGIVQTGSSDMIQLVSSQDGGNAWTLPAAISPNGVGAYVPLVVMDDSENIIIVWQIMQADGTWAIQARKMAPSEWTGTPGPVTSSNTKTLAAGIVLNPSRCPNVRIACNGTGQAIMTWFATTTAENGQQVQAVYYDGSDWSTWQGAVVNLSDLIIPVNAMDWPNQRVAVDGTGNGIVIWQEYDAVGNQRIRTSVYDVGSASWTSSIISMAGQDAAVPYVALTEDGHGFAAWKITDGRTLASPVYSIQVSQYP